MLLPEPNKFLTIRKKVAYRAAWVVVAAVVPTSSTLLVNLAGFAVWRQAGGMSGVFDHDSSHDPRLTKRGEMKLTSRLGNPRVIPGEVDTVQVGIIYRLNPEYASETSSIRSQRFAIHLQ